MTWTAIRPLTRALVRCSCSCHAATCTVSQLLDRVTDLILVSDLRERRQSHVNLLLEARSLKKSSSCSTIFLDDSTISHPNLKNTIKCVSFAIHYHFAPDGQTDMSRKVYEIFDERIHPLNQDVRDIRPPDSRAIYRFMRTLFNAAQLPPECAIITLVYVERLLTYAETTIDAFSWKRIVLGSILLSSKVWDDQAVWNVDYCQILRDIPVEDMCVTSAHLHTDLLVLSTGTIWSAVFWNCCSLTSMFLSPCTRNITSICARWQIRVTSHSFWNL